MGLDRLYTELFRQELGLHAVWTPGTAIEPGDLGFIENGYFRRMGKLSQFSAHALAVKARKVDEDLSFSNGVAFALDAAAQGKIDPSAKIGGSLTIARSGGVALHATGREDLRIDDLFGALDAVPWDNPDYKGDLVFVAEVQVAERVRAIVSESGGASIGVTGKLAPLEALELADASISIGASSAAITKISLGRKQGERYPVGLRLFKKKTGAIVFGRRVRELGADGPQGAPSPYEEVSPYAAAL